MSLERVPPFPRSLDELGAWQVWADQRIEQGDKLGAFLSAELALGAFVEKERIIRFRRFAHSMCRLPRVFEPTWLLGHVRHLSLLSRARFAMLRRPAVLDGGDLLTLRDTLGGARLQNLESFEMSVAPDGLRRRWREASSQFPASCQTLVLHAAGYAQPDADAVVAQLPACFTHLRIEPSFSTAPESFVSDRFAWVDLRSVLVTRELADRLAQTLVRSNTVKLLLGDVIAEPGSRVVIGGVDDARLIDEETGGVRLLERSRLSEIQRRFGVISVFAQLLRGVPETWGFRDRARTRFSPWSGDTIVRRADGTWWLRQSPGVAVLGAPDSEQITALANGARVVIDQRVWKFSSAQRAG